MKKIIIFITLFTHYSNEVFSTSVDSIVAKTVAQNFHARLLGNNLTSPATLVYKKPLTLYPSQYAFYIFNFDSSFVMVSGNDIQEPILGFGSTDNFNILNMAPWTDSFLNDYKRELEFMLNAGIGQNAQILANWTNILNNSLGAVFPKPTVEPLVKTLWGQTTFYNDQCPPAPQPPNPNCAHASAGCTAIAMAQVMNYWKYPKNGVGNHNYVGPLGAAVPNLSANFGITTYNWENMNDANNANKANIAELVFHVGVSIENQYGCNGTIAWVLKAHGNRSVERALEHHFSYDKIMQGIIRKNFTNSEWIDILKNELTSLRPIIYGGERFDNATQKRIGHIWVCDGYKDIFSIPYFHMNWGWEGINNAYFRLNWFSNIDYPFIQYALVKIQPPCYPNVTISTDPTANAKYPAPVTRSKSWIKSELTTIIPSDTRVVTDGDPVEGYIELNPGFESTPAIQITPHIGEIENFFIARLTGCDGGNNIPLISKVKLRASIEGYKNGNTSMTTVLMNQGIGGNPFVTDTITVEFYDENTLNLISSVKTILLTDGTAEIEVPYSEESYYIAIKHRNAIKTWSKNMVSLGVYDAYVDFTNNVTIAAGDNMISTSPNYWSFYSGDLNQDENIDLLDASIMEADISNYLYGYQTSDINGDGNVDLLDASILEENVINYIYSIHP